MYSGETANFGFSKHIMRTARPARIRNATPAAEAAIITVANSDPAFHFITLSLKVKPPKL